MKHLLSFATCAALCALLSLPLCANDGVYYVSGNQLFPMQETDISVRKEILTISLGDDGMADVDVYYEFFNNGPAKRLLMGFEADAPYNASAPFSKKGIHPYIHDFSVTMNGNPLTHSNGVYAKSHGNAPEPLDLKKWKIQEPYTEDMLYNAELDSATCFSYVYKFDAHFSHGLNVVHHTYRYNMSMSVCTLFSVYYKLTPAARWAGQKIGDFTLLIKAPNTAKHFLVDMKPFSDHEFEVTEGAGKIRKADRPYYTNMAEISLRNGTIRWHATDFRPTEELTIHSADLIMEMEGSPFVLGCFYDRSKGYRPELCHFMDGKPLDARILRNLPYAHRGYVFRDKTLAEYFCRLWWYMPDPSWKASTKDFTPQELQFIKKAAK